MFLSASRSAARTFLSACPLILAAILRFGLPDKERMVGTSASSALPAMSSGRGFALVGFSFADYLPMIACASVVATGNVAGGASAAFNGFARAFGSCSALAEACLDALSGLR